jgi:phospholipase C
MMYSTASKRPESHAAKYAGPRFTDVPHGSRTWSKNWNNRRQRRVHAELHAKAPIGYYTAKTLPVLYPLAEQFTVCDKWFSSMLSPTCNGNRMDDLSASSARVTKLS